MMTKHRKSGLNTTAVLDRGTGEWIYTTFHSWTEAVKVVNEARQSGKAAVFYNGQTLSEPPFYTDLSSEVSHY